MSVVRNRKARHSAIGQVLLSLYDIVTDVLFLFEMIGRNGDGAYTSLIVVSVVFTGLAVAVNAVIAALFIKYGNGGGGVCRRRVPGSGVAFCLFFFILYCCLFVSVILVHEVRHAPAHL